MKKEMKYLKDVEINYITFESGDNEALIDCKINSETKSKVSKLIISMSDLNKLLSRIRRRLNSEINIECHKINSDSSFYQIDLKNTGASRLDLSGFLFSNVVRQIIA